MRAQNSTPEHYSQGECTETLAQKRPSQYLSTSTPFFRSWRITCHSKGEMSVTLSRSGGATVGTAPFACIHRHHQAPLHRCTRTHIHTHTHAPLLSLSRPPSLCLPATASAVRLPATLVRTRSMRCPLSSCVPPPSHQPVHVTQNSVRQRRACLRTVHLRALTRSRGWLVSLRRTRPRSPCPTPADP